MESRKPNAAPLCQSCSMPMSKPQDFGTRSDATKHPDYCRLCYYNGQFKQPSMTMQQMASVVAKHIASQLKVPDMQAKEMAKKVLSKLKRWQVPQRQ